MSSTEMNLQATVTVDAEAYCEECGYILDIETHVFREELKIEVTPCPNCLKAAKGGDK